MVGHCLGHFRLLRTLGCGSTGDVFHAEDLRAGRHVALKLLRPFICGDLHALEELRRDAQVLAALRHPHICAIEDVDEYDGHYFIVMELLDGGTLAQSETRVPMALDRLLDVATQMARGLAAAHARGIVHGSIKPSNIYVTHRSQVKLLDFGLSKRVRFAPDRGFGLPPGALACVAPERFRGHEPDARADLFSLGVVVYELATGREPFTAGTAKGMVDQIVHKAPVRASRLNPQLPSGLDWVVHCSLEKDPGSRYQSANDLLADLDRIGCAPRGLA